MHKLTVEIDLSDHLFHAYECEAKRQDKKIEDMIAKLVNGLIREMEQEESEPPMLIS